MKYKIILFVILFPVSVLAQTYGRPDSLIRQLIGTWNMGIENNGKPVDLSTYNKFKTLFDPEATVDDNFNFQFVPEKDTGRYIINFESKQFDRYTHDAALEVSKLRVETGTPKYSTDSLLVEIRRTDWVEKPAKYLLKDTATLINSILGFHTDIEFEKKSGEESDKRHMRSRLKKQILENPDSVYRFRTTYTSRISMIKDSALNVKIKSIEILRGSDTVTCLNDFDSDGILDTVDKAKGKYGDFTANGMPDYDLDSVPDDIDKCKETYAVDRRNQGCPDSYFITRNQVDGFIGVQLNSAVINLPGLNQLGYLDESGNDATDVLQSETGILKNPKLKPGISVGGNYSFYFGSKRKNTGISVGLSYSAFKAEYQLEAPMVYTFKSTDGINNYRRQVSVNSLTEEISYRTLNVPVMLTYRIKSDLFGENKLVINLKTGPSVMIFRNTSDYNASINFGGLYQVDSLRQDAITYYDYFDEGSGWNIHLTPESINAQNANPGDVNVFSQLNSASASYDFASNKNYRENQKLSHSAIAFNFACDFQYDITKAKEQENRLAVKFGLYFVYAPLPERKEKYTPVYKTTDRFNSIYNSTAKSVYSAYGIDAGFVYSF